MESFVRRCVVSSLSLALLATPALGQSSRYVRLDLGAVGVQAPSAAFPTPNASVRPALAAGFLSARGHGVELRVSRLSVETTEYTRPIPLIYQQEAPYTIGVRATPIELGYFYRPNLFGGLLRPQAGVGAIAAHVVDRWRSDTPTEKSSAWQLGASASAGLAVRAAGSASLVVQGGYQRIGSSAERPPRHVGLSGRRIGAGLELGF